MIFNRPTERWMRSKAPQCTPYNWKELDPTHHAHSRTQNNGSMCYVVNFNSRHVRVIKKLHFQFLNIFHFSKFSGTDKNSVNFATYTCKRKLLTNWIMNFTTNFKSIFFAQVIFHFWTKTQKMLTCLCICDSSLRFLIGRVQWRISFRFQLQPLPFYLIFQAFTKTAQEPSEMLRYGGSSRAHRQFRLH